MTPKEAQAWLNKAKGLAPEQEHPKTVLKGYKRFKKGLYFIGKYNGLDTCQYCETSYHPMMRWVNSENEMFFCCGSDECEIKAKKAGFEARPEITPRR